MNFSRVQWANCIEIQTWWYKFKARTHMQDPKPTRWRILIDLLPMAHSAYFHISHRAIYPEVAPFAVA